MAAVVIKILTVLVMVGAAAAEGRISYQDPPRYQFRYSIKDSSAEHFGHSEVRDLGRTEGEYFVQLPDGRMKTVTYIADDSGYHPKVVYKNSENHHSPHTSIHVDSITSPLWQGKLNPSNHNTVSIKSTNPPFRPTRSRNTGYNSIQTTHKPLPKTKLSHRVSKPIYTTAIPPARPIKHYGLPGPSYVTTPSPYDIQKASHHHYKPTHLPYTPLIPNKSSIPHKRPDYGRATKSPVRYGDDPTPNVSRAPSYPAATGPIPIGLVPTFHSKKELFPRPPISNRYPSPQPFPHRPEIYEPTPDQFYHPQKPFKVNPAIFNPLPPLPSYLKESQYDSRGPSVVPRVVAVPIPIEEHNQVKPIRHYQLDDRSKHGRSLSNFESKRRSNLPGSSSSTRRRPSSRSQAVGLASSQPGNNIRSSAVVRNNDVVRLIKTIEDELADYDEAL